ncbi:MAG: plasmid recombination protein [Aphanocapsa lilacina HA4352-LM1]|jgi:DNA repair exonuclease SbcCD ATPase subunit|nr:plasmid recombination protein [Aphanocapsa lilacina HA4352-LM1]
MKQPWDANVEWLQRVYGDRVVSAVLHLDEATPHIQAHLVPLDTNGKLNCRALFGGRQKLQSLQDGYAAAMAPQGLERGVRNSQARHQEVRQYYTQVQTPPVEVEVELPAVDGWRDRLDPQGYRQRAGQAVREQVAPVLAVLGAKSRDRDRAVRQAEEYRRTAERAEQRAAEAEEHSRQQIARSREQAAERIRLVQREAQTEMARVQQSAEQSVGQVRGEAAAQVAVIRQQANEQVEQASAWARIAEEQARAAGRQAAQAQAQARSEAQAELEEQKREVRRQHQRLHSEQRAIDRLQSQAAESARAEAMAELQPRLSALQEQAQQQRLESRRLQMGLQTASGRVEQLQAELESVHAERLEEIRAHQEQASRDKRLQSELNRQLQ